MKERIESVKMIRSLSDNNNEILKNIRDLYCPEGYECDLTYGNGSFWKELGDPPYCYDITPLKSHVMQGDSRHIDLPNNSLTNIVFDPPFLTYIKNGREHNNKMIMSSRFGGYYSYNELEEHYNSSILEMYRLLKDKGKMIFKCQDIVHNHEHHSTHTKVINYSLSVGFKLLDLFILGSNHRLKFPQVGKQRHARIYHSYFLVFEKRKGRK